MQNQCFFLKNNGKIKGRGHWLWLDLIHLCATPGRYFLTIFSQFTLTKSPQEVWP